jgi:hypothetical protein
MKKLSNLLRSPWTLLAVGPLVFFACGEEELPSGNDGGTGASVGTGARSGSGGTPNGAGGDSGQGVGEAGRGGGDGDLGQAGSSPGDEDAVYALTTQVLGEQAADNLSYVLLTTRLDGEVTLDLKDAVVEVAGRALGTGPDGAGTLFVASDGAPTITRYELSEAGKLVEGDSVSFLGVGVSAFGEYGGQFQYASAEKAYWFDGATARIVVWNPSEMQVEDTISLDELAHAGEILSFTAAPVWSGSTLYSFAAWRSTTAVPSRLAVIVLDTTTDEVTVVEDTRCGYVRDGVLADDGLLYVATEAYGAALNYLNSSNAAAPCLLRFDTETNEFDAEFHVELPSLFKGAPAGSLIVGPENQPFLRYLDASAVSPDVMNARVLASAPAWGWAKLGLSDEPSVEKLSDAPLSSGSMLPFTLGERRFAPTFVAAEETAFVELGPDGPTQGDGIVVPGLVFSAVKLR